MTNFSCDIEEIENCDVSDLTPGHLTEPNSLLRTVSDGPSFKRARLSEKSGSIINGYYDLSSEKYPQIRLHFENKLKIAIQHKLTELLNPLVKSEKVVSELKIEIDQLKGRIDDFENSSNDLKKLIVQCVSFVNCIDVN